MNVLVCLAFLASWRFNIGFGDAGTSLTPAVVEL